MIRGSAAAGLLVLLWTSAAHAGLALCRRGHDGGRIVEALTRLRASVDPCGESGQVLAVLDRVEHCARATYEICTSRTADRNLFYRPTAAPGRNAPRIITWNPDLRSELERGCDGNPSQSVTRDPVASLLHELVHALEDCEGLEPGEHELEAVRIENIYRRSAGLCQRRRYGEELLPPAMSTTCTRLRPATVFPRPHSRRTGEGETSSLPPT